MSRLIDGDALYEQLKQDEEMAINRVLDTESSLPYPNNLNPVYTRYVAQMNERTRLKHMVADAPRIEERKTGKWIDDGTELGCQCPECGKTLDDYLNGNLESITLREMPNYCPNCGADMRGDSNDRQM